MIDEVAIMNVYGRDQLAAAVRSVPHDGPVKIVLHRATGTTTYSFNYDKAQFKTKRGRGRIRPNWQEIDERLINTARRIRQQPRELFE